MMIIKESNGCALSIRDGLYIMAGGRTGSHTLDVASTDDARLAAHWEGYLAANPLLTFTVHYTRENQHREYTGKLDSDGCYEKAAKKRRTRKTVKAVDFRDAAAQAKAYSLRFYPQCSFTLEGVVEITTGGAK